MSKVFVLGRVRYFQNKHHELLEEVVNRCIQLNHVMRINEFVGGDRTIQTRTPFPERVLWKDYMTSFFEDLRQCAKEGETLILEQLWMDDEKIKDQKNGSWGWFAKIDILGTSTDTGEKVESHFTVTDKVVASWESCIWDEVERLSLADNVGARKETPLLAAARDLIYQSWFDTMSTMRF